MRYLLLLMRQCAIVVVGKEHREKNPQHLIHIREKTSKIKLIIGGVLTVGELGLGPTYIFSLRFFIYFGTNFIKNSHLLKC